jgi:hypothetical protein
MENFTIHVFGYGETQINSKEVSVKIKTKDLTTVQPLIDAVFKNKPTDNTSAVDNYHTINFFGYEDIRWVSKQKGGFSLKDNKDVKPFIDSLIEELKKKNTPVKTAKL